MRNTNLQHLSLKYNKITNKGAAVLFKNIASTIDETKLISTLQLRYLGLQENYICTAGVLVIEKLIELLRILSTSSCVQLREDIRTKIAHLKDINLQEQLVFSMRQTQKNAQSNF